MCVWSISLRRFELFATDFGTANELSVSLSGDDDLTPSSGGYARDHVEWQFDELSDQFLSSLKANLINEGDAFLISICICLRRCDISIYTEFDLVSIIFAIWREHYLNSCEFIWDETYQSKDFDIATHTLKTDKLSEMWTLGFQWVLHFVDQLL